MSEVPQESPQPIIPDAAIAPAPLAITAEMLSPVERRVDFEKGISYVPPMTLGLIVACMTVFVIEMIAGATKSRDSIIAAGALWKPAVVEGQVWRIFTSMFLHADVGHIIGNCMALYVLGMAAEHGFGVVRAAVLYLFSGVCGAVLSLLLTTGPSVGASGAIFGLAGGIIVFFWKYHRIFLIRDKRIGAALLVWALYTILTGFLQPEIDNYAHIGGFVGGALAGAVLPRRRRPELEAAFAVILSGGVSPVSRGDGRLM